MKVHHRIFAVCFFAGLTSYMQAVWICNNSVMSISVRLRAGEDPSIHQLLGWTKLDSAVYEARNKNNITRIQISPDKFNNINFPLRLRIKEGNEEKGVLIAQNGLSPFLPLNTDSSYETSINLELNTETRELSIEFSNPSIGTKKLNPIYF